MGYSTCLECKNMVSSYEKYCQKCAFGKRNDLMFWKTHDYSFYNEPKRSQEIAKDTMDVSELKQAHLERFQMIECGANPDGNRAQRRKNAALARRNK